MLWVGLVLLALVSTGCGSGMSGGGSKAMDAAPQVAQNNAAPQNAQKQQENAPAVGVQQQERQLVRTATVDLRSDDVLKAIQARSRTGRRRQAGSRGRRTRPRAPAR